MEIAEIKQKLDIIGLAEGFGIRVDRNGKALCPFHSDTSPSLQFSTKKQICTCFSSNCGAGTMDLIGLTERYLQVNTHEALKYLAKLAGEEPKQKKPSTAKSNPKARDYAKDFEQMKSSYLSSSIARKYTESRNLSRQLQCFGYNAYKDSRFDYLKGCIIFGLRNESGKVVSLYGRSVKSNDKSKHYYTPNRQGLFPSYPRAKSSKLILTESVIDAATLLSVLEVTKDYEILALYGTNGLTAEHIHALQKLPSLTEIIFFFDGDAAGRAAVEKQGAYLHELFPKLQLSKVNTPENEDVNSLAVGHESCVFLQLLKERSELLFSQERLPKEKTVSETTENPSKPTKKPTYQLEAENPNNLVLQTETATYYIKGGLRKDLDSLKVTLVIEHPASQKKSRNKLDLYEDRQSSKVCREAAEKLDLRADKLESDVNLLTDLLDAYREAQQEQSKEVAQQKPTIPSSTKKECLDFLKEPSLLSRINELIGESGVVGEEHNRIFLFGIAASYKMEDTLHALIQGSSGSGKTHLLASILSMMPPEDVISLTRVTESSFYNYGEYDLQNKLIGLEDYDGLEEKAELAFRELQSKGMISSSTSMKDEQTGKISAQVREVHGPIASLSATTRGEVYEDNMSRCFLVAVDESQEQTLRIIKAQNRAAAGYVDKKRCKEITSFLQYCIRLLQPLEVINPYADKIDLPKEAHKIRRLNSLFQSYVRQITLINQYQRKKDKQGRLLSEKADIEEAIKIMFESIILKVDELDGSLRGFYEKLKSYIKKHGAEYEFSQREIRQEFRVSKSQMQRYINQLLDLEYLTKTYISARNTHHYKIAYWDNMKALRDRISKNLHAQLNELN